jgi:hypothetical protein
MQGLAIKPAPTSTPMPVATNIPMPTPIATQVSGTLNVTNTFPNVTTAPVR